MNVEIADTVLFDGRRATASLPADRQMNTNGASAVSIVVIGNQLLLGQFADANGPYLCSYVTRNGGRVQRVVIVGDDREAIALENPIGTAPGSYLAATEGWVMSLPGVPAELRAIVEGPGAPISKRYWAVGLLHSSV